MTKKVNWTITDEAYRNLLISKPQGISISKHASNLINRACEDPLKSITEQMKEAWKVFYDLKRRKEDMEKIKSELR